MKLTQLRYLQAVIETGSFRAAARRLGVSQPTVSEQIKLLEEELDLVLVSRGGGSTKPTAEAATLMPIVGRLLDEERNLREEAASVHGLNTGTVRLGSISTLSQTIVAEVLPTYRHVHPRIKFSVFEGGSRTITEQVRSGDLDLGLIAMAADEPLGDEYVVSHLFDDRTVLCVPKSFNTPHGARLRLPDLAAEPWIVQGEEYSRHRMLTRLAGSTALNVVYQSNNPNSTLRLVAAGVGIALVSEMSYLTCDLADRRQVRLIPIDAPAMVLCMVSRTHAAPSPAVRELRPLLRRAAVKVRSRLQELDAQVVSAEGGSGAQRRQG